VRLRHSFVCHAINGLRQPHGITFSMGVAEREAGTESLDALIAEADRQLYLAKAQGRNAVCGVGLSAAAAA